MEVFGSFEATKVAREGNFGAVMFARRAGTSEERFAVKIFRPPEWMMEEGQIDSEAGLFLESAEAQKGAHAVASGSWAPVYEMGRCEGGAWLASDLFECSLEWLRINHRELEAEHIQKVIETIVLGLVGLKQSQGRAHGNLKPTNVLVQGRADLLRARILLCDPKPASRNKGIEDELRDARDLGDIVHQLVLHRPFLNVTEWPLQSSDKWQRLGRAGAQWLELVNKLIDPTTTSKPSLEEIGGMLPRPLKIAPIKAAAPVAGPSAKEREEAERKAREAEKKTREEAERIAREEADRRVQREAEIARRVREEAERKAQEEAARKQREEAERKAKQEETERRARQEAEQRAKADAERKVKEEAERQAREAEKKVRDQADRKAREEADRLAKEEADRKAKETKEETERRAKEDAERRAREEAQRKAKEETERQAREAATKAREEAERKAREDAERQAREAAERKAKGEADRKAREAEKKAREDAEKQEKQRAKEEAARRKAESDAARKVAQAPADVAAAPAEQPFAAPEERASKVVPAKPAAGGNKKIVIAAAALVLIAGGVTTFLMMRGGGDGGGRTPGPGPGLTPKQISAAVTSEVGKRGDAIKAALTEEVRGWLNTQRTSAQLSIEKVAKTVAIDAASKAAAPASGQRASDAVGPVVASASPGVRQAAEAEFGARVVADAAKKLELTALRTYSDQVSDAVLKTLGGGDKALIDAEVGKAVQARADQEWAGVYAAELERERSAAVAAAEQVASAAARETYLRKHGTDEDPSLKQIASAASSQAGLIPVDRVRDELKKGIVAWMETSPGLTIAREASNTAANRIADDAALPSSGQDAQGLADAVRTQALAAGSKAASDALAGARPQDAVRQGLTGLSSLADAVKAEVKWVLPEADDPAITDATAAALRARGEAEWEAVLGIGVTERAGALGIASADAARQRFLNRIKACDPAPVRTALVTLIAKLDAGVQPEDGGGQIQRDAEAIKGMPCYSSADIEDVRGEVEARLALLEQIGGETDVVRLASHATPAAGKTAASELILAWNRLGSSQGRVDLGALGAARVAAVGGLERLTDSTAREKILSAIDLATGRIWSREASAAASDKEVDAVSAARQALGVTDATVPDAVKMNFALREFRKAIQQQQDAGEARAIRLAGPAQALRDAIQGVAGADADRLRAAAGVIADWKSGGIQPAPPGDDPTRLGPATVGWSAQSSGGGETVTFSPPAGFTNVDPLVFHRIGSAYLCETELSFGQFAGAFRDGLAPIAQSYGNPSSPYLKVWQSIRDAAPSRVARIVESTDFRTAAEVARWFGAADQRQLRPENTWPLQFISAKAAAVISAKLGCRLPTVEEWSAASRAEGQARSNLRDAAWRAVWTTARGFELADGSRMYPDKSALQNEGANARPADDVGDDGLAFFAPVNAEGFGTRWKHLVGNVGEWAVPGTPVEAQPQAVGEVPDMQFSVVGGSAVGPPRLSQQPAESAQNRAGYFDVGLRLAFSAGGGGGGLGAGGGTPPPDREIDQLATMAYVSAAQ
ncbi:MAG: hypothetical protein IT435_01745 [Phycisphaerales bacterium]|nr:hypothetical protein [Phycisphaerales bacterium]